MFKYYCLNTENYYSKVGIKQPLKPSSPEFHQITTRDLKVYTKTSITNVTKA